MSGIMHKLANRMLRKARIRARVIGTEERPRLSVYVSNRHIHAQIIDDTTGKTLVSSTSVVSNVKGSLGEKAALIGKDISAKAKKAKIVKVVFDRNGRQYHGRLKALADAAREGGLEF
jgi:large subunit ribosomal protein L18